MAKRFESDACLIAEHRSWLSEFCGHYLRTWECLLTAEPEAAECEAAIRRLLQQHGCSVEPNGPSDGSRRSPDFHCRRSGHSFFVEAACITIEQASNITKLTPLPQPSHYELLTEKIWDVCKAKTTQCCDLGQPVLLAVGTFHYNASARCFSRRHVEEVLIGIPRITQLMDTTTGEAKGAVREHTNLDRAAFVKLDKTSEMDYARRPVSAILLCGLGSTPPQVRGALHPCPIHVFDRNLLCALEFCQLRHTSGCISAEWV